MTTNCGSGILVQNRCAAEVFYVRVRKACRASWSASRNWISFRRNWCHTRRRSGTPSCGRTDDFGHIQLYIDHSPIRFNGQSAVGQEIGHRYTGWRLYRWLRILHCNHFPIAVVEGFHRQVGAEHRFHRHLDLAANIHVTDIDINLVENLDARLRADVERIRDLLQRCVAGPQAPLGQTPRPPRVAVAGQAPPRPRDWLRSSRQPVWLTASPHHGWRGVVRRPCRPGQQRRPHRCGLVEARPT